MATINEQRRLILKRSAIPGTIPTVPAVDNIDTFTATDIFKGELFYNIPDNILYTRDNTGIVIVASGGPGPTYVYYTENTTPGSEDGKIEIVSGVENAKVEVKTGNEVILFAEDTSTTTYTQIDTVPTSCAILTTNGSNSSQLINNTNNTTLRSGDGTIISKVYLTSAGDAELSVQNGSDLHKVICQDGTGVQISSTNGVSSTGLNLVPSGGFSVSNVTTIGESGAISISTDEIDFISDNGSNHFEMKIKSSKGVNMSFLPSYNNDTAAGLGGLTTGDLYQTTGSGAAPLNVAGIVMIKQ